METKEAFRDRYVKAQQEGTFVERFHVSGVYMDSIGDVLSDRVSDFPTEKQVKYVVSWPGTANPVIVESGVSIGEEEAVFYVPLAGAANFVKFVPEEPVVKAEPVAHLYWLDEAFAGLRVEKKEQVEVYPGYWVPIYHINMIGCVRFWNKRFNSEVKPLIIRYVSVTFD